MPLNKLLTIIKSTLVGSIVKKYHSLLTTLCVISVLFILIFGIYGNDKPEWFSGASLWVENLVVLSQSYFVGYIIYLLSAYYPWVVAEKVRVTEQNKMDEVASFRLNKVITNVMQVIYAVTDYRLSQFEIYLKDYNEQDFKDITKDIHHTDQMQHLRSIRVHGENYGRPMRVGENVQDCVESVRESIEHLIKLDAYISIDLLTLLFEVQENYVISNWENYIDDSPTIVGKRALVPVKRNLDVYSKLYLELHLLLKKLEEHMKKYPHTKEYKKYSDHRIAIKQRLENEG